MALSGPDGETISHLAPADQRNSHELGPDRGHRVGPWAGDPLPLDPPESTLPARKLHVVPITEESADARRIAQRNIRHLLEHQPMVEWQRQALMEAMNVLETFA